MQLTDNVYVEIGFLGANVGYVATEDGVIMMDTYEMVTKIRQKEISELLTKDTRIDGRQLTDYRKITTEVDLIEKASGSAQVSLGKTKVLVGIKVETGEPFPDKPQDGVLTVNMELVPLASPSFEPGPPREEAIELARVVDRGLRESKAVALEKLCIIPGKLVFVIFVDIYVLDHDGNLFDASALASILALMNTKLREYSLLEDGQLNYKESSIDLPLQNIPIEVTVAKIDNKLLVDPSLEEEALTTTQITIAIGKNDEICAVQKSKLGTLSLNEVNEAIEIAKAKATEIRNTIIGDTKEWLGSEEKT